MKEEDLYQKTLGNMVFSVYMRRRHKHDIAHLAKKTKMPLSRKNTSRGDISGITKKDDIHPGKNGIFADIPHWLTPRKGPICSHRRCSTRKGVLRNFAKFTGKDLCQGLFFNKATGLRPATLLKKKLWRKCFPVNFVKFLRAPFFQNTPGWPLLEFQLFSVLLWRPFMETFLYNAFQWKKSRQLNT